MKNILLLSIIILTFSTTGVGQTTSCDTATIYATTGANAVCMDTMQSNVRAIFSNSYPDSAYTSFSFGNGSASASVTEEDIELYSCFYPTPNDYFIKIDTPSNAGKNDALTCPGFSFGVMSNGIYISPTAGIYYTDGSNVTHEEWEYEILTQTKGWDNNDAHKQSSGRYHYHGNPEQYAIHLGYNNSAQHSGIIGWAADGYPIYYKYGYSDPNDVNSAIVELTSCWGVRSGDRSTLGYADYPSGNFDGTYQEDYQYPAVGTVVANCSLDSANGRWAKTPEFPSGTYHYVITQDWPYVPRYFKATPDNSYKTGPGNCNTTEAFDDCSSTAYNASVHLPVELVYFKGQSQSDYNLLQWQTASELNSSHFEIERSVDGSSFEMLDIIESAHFTSRVQNYSFQDFDLEETVYYYRLKMVDYDGEFEYSKIVQIESRGTDTKQHIYPNPVGNELTIEEGIGNITIFNALGQPVRQIFNNNQILKIDTGNLPQGMYILHLQKLNGEVFTTSFLK